MDKEIARQRLNDSEPQVAAGREKLDKVRGYWDLLGAKAPEGCKDHLVDERGAPLPRAIYDDLAAYVLAQLDSLGKTHRPSILEVGCGTGRILEVLNRERPGSDISGIDFSEVQIRHARRNVPDAKLFVGDLEQFVGSTGQEAKKDFDLIYLHSVTQYFPSREYFEGFLHHCAGLLRVGGGLCLIDTPIDWYYEQMRGKPPESALTPLKN